MNDEQLVAVAVAVEVTETHSTDVDGAAPNSIDCCGFQSLLITPREDTWREWSAPRGLATRELDPFQAYSANRV